MWYFILYLVSIASKISGFLYITGTIGLTLIGGTNLFYFLNEGSKSLKFKKLGVLCITFLFLTALIPCKKDILLIVGGGMTINYVSNSEEIKELPENLVNFFNKELKYLIEDKKDLNKLTKEELIRMIPK